MGPRGIRHNRDQVHCTGHCYKGYENYVMPGFLFILLDGTTGNDYEMKRL